MFTHLDYKSTSTQAVHPSRFPTHRTRQIACRSIASSSASDQVTARIVADRHYTIEEAEKLGAVCDLIATATSNDDFGLGLLSGIYVVSYIIYLFLSALVLSGIAWNSLPIALFAYYMILVTALFGLMAVFNLSAFVLEAIIIGNEIWFRDFISQGHYVIAKEEQKVAGRLQLGRESFA